MPFALGLIGLLLIITGAKGTYGDLKTLLVSDFTGSGNFFNWIIALGVAGSIGYVPGAEKFSRAFIVLILIAMVLATGRGQSGGFFKKFTDALKSVEGGTSNSSGGKTEPASGNTSSSPLPGIGQAARDAGSKIVTGIIGKIF